MNKKTQQEKILEKVKDQEKYEKIKSYLSVDYYNIAEKYLNEAERSSLDFEIRQNSLISIVFSALTLEASINDIGIEYLKEIFDDIKELSFPKKWRVAIKLLLKNGQNIDKFNNLYGKLRKLNTLRNDLVHYKSKFESPVIDKNGRKIPSIDKRVNMNEAKEYFQLIENTLRAFQELTNVEKIPVLRKINVEKESGKVIHQLGEGKKPLIARLDVKSIKKQ